MLICQHPHFTKSSPQQHYTLDATHPHQTPLMTNTSRHISHTPITLARTHSCACYTRMHSQTIFSRCCCCSDSQVDWTAELPCFQGLARQLALLFRVSAMGAASQTEPGESAAAPATDACGDAVGREDEEARSEAWTIQHVLLPAIRRDYEAPAAHSSNGTVVQVACTEMLYKIFERC